jgi:hypothetical protein
MFQAVLFRKLDESLFAKQEFEDILTSDVFGAFKYLPADYFYAWIAKLRDRHPLLTPAFNLVSGFPDVEFWPQLNAAKEAGHICEPDVVLWWEHLAVVVEAKRASNFQLEQLLVEKESTQQAAMARGLAAQVIVVAVGRNRPSWWLAQRQTTRHWLAFSTWGTLADIFLATLNIRRAAGCKPEEAALVSDLLARLDMRDVQPFRGFRSLAGVGGPSSRPSLPCAVRRISGVFPLRVSPPDVEVPEIWPPPKVFRSNVIDLARSVPARKASQLVGRAISRGMSRVPDFPKLSRGCPKRLADFWQLPLVGMLSSQRGILVWEKAPQVNLTKVWKPSVHGKCSIRIRGAPTTEASRLFWTPKNTEV